jgi:hypothetical protein
MFDHLFARPPQSLLQQRESARRYAAGSQPTEAGTPGTTRLGS